MAYKEIVEEWKKSSESFFDYRFEVASFFLQIYNAIAKKLSIDSDNKLNDQMKVFPIKEKNETTLLHSTYSLPGSVGYEKRGWASIGLRLIVNELMAQILGCEISEYRFIFFIKRINNNWYFFIDTNYYHNNIEDGIWIGSEKDITEVPFNSTMNEYFELVFNYMKQALTKKTPWDSKYKSELETQFSLLTNLLKSKLEISDSKLLTVCPSKKDDSTEKTVYKILDCLEYETEDWCSLRVMLLLERGENTYPKANCQFIFYLKKIGEEWFYSNNALFFDEHYQEKFEPEESTWGEKLISSVTELAKVSFSFDRWLEDNSDVQL